jgi:hypothetical protein
MTIIRGAKRVLQIQSNIKEFAITALADTMSEANTVLSNTTDHNAKRVIADLLGALTNINQIFLSNRDRETDELIATIYAEELHFNKTMRRNNQAREYQTQNRLKQGVVPRSPELTLPAPKEKDEIAPPIPKTLLPQLREVWETSSTTTATSTAAWQRAKNKEEIQKQEQEWIENNRNKERNIIPPGEAISIAEAQKQQEKVLGKNKFNEQIIEDLIDQTLEKASPMRKVNYDPDVISASLPTQDEANKINIPLPGSNENLL